MYRRYTGSVASLAKDIPARERLLIAGAQLLGEAQGGDIGTRAILELAGVQAPTLYHHFGSKQGLLDEVVSHGFRQFLAARAEAGSDDPVADVRAGWDTHVRFGMDYPAFYAYIYSRVERGQQCGVVAEVEEMILRALEPVAAAGRLRVPARDAAREILAASTGVLATMIADPDETIDWALSQRTRDAILESLLGPESTASGRRTQISLSAAHALLAALDAGLAEKAAFTPAETMLLKDWIERLRTAM